MNIFQNDDEISIFLYLYFFPVKLNIVKLHLPAAHHNKEARAYIDTSDRMKYIYTSIVEVQLWWYLYSHIELLYTFTLDNFSNLLLAALEPNNCIF